MILGKIGIDKEKQKTGVEECGNKDAIGNGGELL